MKNDLLKDAILEAQVEASLGGHQLDPIEEVENGCQAVCITCGRSNWVRPQRLRYSLLAEVCEGNRDNKP